MMIRINTKSLIFPKEKTEYPKLTQETILFQTIKHLSTYLVGIN